LQQVPSFLAWGRGLSTKHNPRAGRAKTLVPQQASISATFHFMEDNNAPARRVNQGGRIFRSSVNGKAGLAEISVCTAAKERGGYGTSVQRTRWSYADHWVNVSSLSRERTSDRARFRIRGKRGSRMSGGDAGSRIK
jgi:hypothetical protein